MSDAKMQRAGDAVVAKVERFRAEHGRLPVDLAEVGHMEDDGLYYTVGKDGVYRIWYGKGLGESGKYDSDERVWMVVD